MKPATLATFTAPNGRVWRQYGPTFWWCHETGDVVTGLDALKPDGSLKAQDFLDKVVGKAARRKCLA